MFKSVYSTIPKRWKQLDYLTTELRLRKWHLIHRMGHCVATKNHYCKEHLVHVEMPSNNLDAQPYEHWYANLKIMTKTLEENTVFIGTNYRWLEECVYRTGRCSVAQLASIRQMSGQVSRGLAGDYQSDERAGVARLSWRVSGRWAGRCRAAQLASIRQMSGQV